ncbi:DUF6946 family protein [Paenibacillus sp. YYML68]|uniref:DUF6946 family protein n=1 Tax=Paenibacillus sp. YYML68 TaxID=2909250 RepID=UPI0024922453|nr:hypothetical protein [Paenibacillus sp. YYML68]
MIIKNQAGQTIHSLDEWLKYAPPAKGEKHWKDGRSAKEFAKAWMSSNGARMPSYISDFLLSQACTVGFQPEWATPEHETKLDNLKGNCRNHDMIVVGNANGKKTLCAVEAKVDESFGEIVSDYVIKSRKKNPRSQVPERINNLSTALFGLKDIGALRYQLIHAIAGTLIEAKSQGADQAVFIVHEFVPFGKASKKAKQNEEALQEFVESLAGTPLSSGQLKGPIFVPGNDFIPNDIPLYIGKVETVLGMNQWQVSVAAEAITAALFARAGYDVSVQYGANQPEYDLMVAKGNKMLKISVKGSQDGGWGLTQSHMSDANYHAAADAWYRKHKPHTVICLVQFNDVTINEMPRVYLATPLDIANHLKKSANGRGETILYEFKQWTDRAFGAGTTDQIPADWLFSESRITDVLEHA